MPPSRDQKKPAKRLLKFGNWKEGRGRPVSLLPQYRPAFDKGKAGGAEGSRTPYLRIANATLYQMSYSPTRKPPSWRVEEQAAPRGGVSMAIYGIFLHNRQETVDFTCHRFAASSTLLFYTLARIRLPLPGSRGEAKAPPRPKTPRRSLGGALPAKTTESRNRSIRCHPCYSETEKRRRSLSFSARATPAAGPWRKDT